MHGGVGNIEVYADTILHGGVAVAAQRHDTLDKIRDLGRNRQRIPAHLVGGRGHLVEGAAAQQRGLRKLAIRLMHDRRPDAITPRAAVERTWRGEGCSADLFGVEPQRRLLRGVLSPWQRAGLCLSGKLIAKPALIL